MDAAQKKAVETSLAYKFARDLIRYVLLEHMTGLQWTPNGIFKETDADSPFTPQLKAAIKEELDDKGHVFHKVFDDSFPDKSLVNNTYLEVCQKSKDTFVLAEFDIGSFISFSVFLALFAGLSYHYGGNFGPSISHVMIVEAVTDLMKLKKWDDNIWGEMQSWSKNRKKPTRLFTSVLHDSK